MPFPYVDRASAACARHDGRGAQMPQLAGHVVTCEEKTAQSKDLLDTAGSEAKHLPSRAAAMHVHMAHEKEHICLPLGALAGIRPAC